MIYDIIEELRSDNSRLFKEAILKKEKDNELLKQVFLASLNPLTQYYIRKIPAYREVTEGHEVAYSLEMVFSMKCLEQFSQRKVTGNAASQYLSELLSSVTPKDAEVIKLIIGKDLKCGVSTATVNKIWKNLIPEIPYMRCSSLKEMKNVDWSKGLYSQVKADGAFVNINYHLDGEIQMFTRGGNFYDMSQFEELEMELKSNLVPGYQYHGELLVIDADGKVYPRKTGNGILNSVLKGGSFGFTEFPMIELWDMIRLETSIPGGSYTKKYEDRYKTLLSLIKDSSQISVIETVEVFSFEEALVHYRKCLALGLEGTILKLKDAIWEDKTSKSQWKLKIDFDCDLEIVQFNEGNGKNAKTFGSIKCRTSDGKLEVNVSGFTDDEREEFHSRRGELIGKVMTVKANDVQYSDNMCSLFLPRFVELRNDKFVADTLEKVEAAYQSKIS